MKSMFGVILKGYLSQDDVNRPLSVELEVRAEDHSDALGFALASGVADNFRDDDYESTVWRKRKTQ